MSNRTQKKMGRPKGLRKNKETGEWYMKNTTKKKAKNKKVEKSNLLDSFSEKLIDRLETDLVMLRQDYERRLQDKDVVIANLREEKQQLISKVALYELTILPRASVQGAEVVAYQKPTKPTFSAKDFLSNPPIMTRWQQLNQQHEEQMKAEDEAEKAAKQDSQG